MIARPVGSSVRLKCTASGTPRPDIVWLKDDQPLTEREVGEGRQNRWTLTLKNLTPAHSGRYTCRVSNQAGEINATYKVEVIREYCRKAEMNFSMFSFLFFWNFTEFLFLNQCIHIKPI